LHYAQLRRRLDVLTEVFRRKVGERERLRDKAQAWAVIEAALAAAGMPDGEPDRRGWWAVVGAADELAKLGDSPELRRADIAFIAADPLMEPHEPWARQVADRIPRFVGQPPPEPGRSLYDWYAWALARTPPP